MRRLTFCAWYSWLAVYLSDEGDAVGDGWERDSALVFYGDHRFEGWGVYKALGYDCERLDDVPTGGGDMAPEFTWDQRNNGCWKPPGKLSELKAQFAAYRRRLLERRVNDARKELERCEILWSEQQDLDRKKQALSASKAATGHQE